MSNLHKNCLSSVSLVRREFKTGLNRAKYKNLVVGVCVTDRLDRKKYPEKSSFAHRVARRYIEQRFCTVCKQLFLSYRRYVYSWFASFLLPAIIARFSNYSNSSGNAVYQSRSSEQTRSVERRALYGTARGLVPKWLLQGSALPRVPPSFFSRYSSVADPLVFRICNFHVSRARHDKHYAAKSL